MTWVKRPGLDGLVWEPDPQPAAEKKHNCRDCFRCQMCSDVRCAQCLKRKPDRPQARGTTKRETRPALNNFLGQENQQDLRLLLLVGVGYRGRHHGELEVKLADHQQVVAVVDHRQ